MYLQGTINTYISSYFNIPAHYKIVCMRKIHLVKGALAVLLSTCFFTACNKPLAKSKTQLLTQASWKIVNAGIDREHNGTIAIVDTAFIKHGKRTQTLIFQPDGSGIYNEEPSREDGSPLTQPFNWQFTGDESRLVLGLDTATVLSIDDKNLKIYYDDNMAD